MKLLLPALLAATVTLTLNAQPVVAPDGRITFRLHAPEAADVRIYCEGVPEHTLQKGSDGNWTLTTAPLEPDIFTYSFAVDGVHLTDPANPFLKYNLLGSDSQVEVPGPNSLPWRLNEVPHGQIHRIFYHSTIAGDDRDCLVYTPPDYRPGQWHRYPVLYLLHGYSDDESAWTSVGRAHVILDNLIARRQAVPMMVVMPLGYGNLDVLRAGWGKIHNRELWQGNIDRFGRSLFEEVIPRLQQNFPVAAGPKNTAIAGLSMGGAEALTIGLNHPDRFGWIGSFSAGGVDTNYPARFPQAKAELNRKLHLLWIACGRSDGLFTNNVAFSQWLDQQGITHTWHPTDGPHCFRVWRRNLADFAPLLFRSK